ncbi:MAG TPA: DUF72 domain-containing protein [Candidatus Thermoplasmatota archaeon]|nr:DUF72 domain-containing protein [Candidatus Thermoplasmatota archaeon]
MPPRVRIGIVGWNYPEWRGSVYSAKAKPADLLAEYARRFPIVEAASGYYGMPKTETVARWAADTPDDFVVSLKMPDWLVRKKPGDPDLPRALGILLQHLEPLAAAGKLGAVVAQFHPSFTREKRAAELAGFVAALPPGPAWAIELRHDSWWRPETYRLLEDSGVTLVWSALEAGFRTPPVATTRSLYLRLFGDRTLEPPYATKRRDARDELALWAERIRTAAPDVDRVDVLVSKYLEGYAPGTADTLAQMLGVPLREPAAAPRGQTTLPF